MKSSHFFRILHITILGFMFFTFKIYAIETIDERVKKLTLELRCMTCQNQSVYDSDSEFANDIKDIVKEKFNEGLNEKEIKMFLTDRYGEYILFKPYFSLKNMLLWISPFLILLVSLGFFARNLKKNPSS